MTEQTTRFEGGSGAAGRSAEDVNATGKWAGMQYGKNIKLGPVVAVNTLDFRPTCSCNAGEAKAIILDPFGGTGTVAEVAERNGRDWIIVDIDPKSIEMAEERLRLGPVEYETHEGVEWVQPKLVRP